MAKQERGLAKEITGESFSKACYIPVDNEPRQIPRTYGQVQAVLRDMLTLIKGYYNIPCVICAYGGLEGQKVRGFLCIPDQRQLDEWIDYGLEEFEVESDSFYVGFGAPFEKRRRLQFNGSIIYDEEEAKRLRVLCRSKKEEFMSKLEELLSKWKAEDIEVAETA